jgi:hypothetical protein
MNAALKYIIAVAGLFALSPADATTYYYTGGIVTASITVPGPLPDGQYNLPLYPIVGWAATIDNIMSPGSSVAGYFSISNGNIASWHIEGQLRTYGTNGGLMFAYLCTSSDRTCYDPNQP